jgi:hypothetical protein
VKYSRLHGSCQTIHPGGYLPILADVTFAFIYLQRFRNIPLHSRQSGASQKREKLFSFLSNLNSITFVLFALEWF